MQTSPKAKVPALDGIAQNELSDCKRVKAIEGPQFRAPRRPVEGGHLRHYLIYFFMFVGDKYRCSSPLAGEIAMRKCC